MKKYMFVIPSLSKGGAERVISVLASTLVQGAEVTILRYFKTDMDYPVHERVKIITLSQGFERDYKKMGKLARSRQMHAVFAKEKPDVIVPFLRHVNLQTYLSVPARFRKRIVFTIRNNPANEKMAIHDWMIRHLNKTIVQNEDQKNYFPKEAQKRIYVMPNPVNPDFFQVEPKKETEKTVITSAGRLNKQKNFSMIIDCAEVLSKKYDNLEFRIYGEGEQRRELEEKIRSRGLENLVILKGRTASMNEVYAQADIFAMTSIFEGIPNALMEAMAAGVASVSTDCPTGPSTIIENGKTGILVPVGDVDAMTGAIAYLIENPEKRKRIALQGREAIREKYLPKKIAQIFKDICER